MFGNPFFYLMSIYSAGADTAAIFQLVTPVFASLAIITRV
jgi:hypothetical protein